MAKVTRIIVNRQKASFNRKHKGKLPEEPVFSIHKGNEIDYAYGVRLIGNWNLIQDYANSPCSGAHAWLEAGPGATYEITSRVPISQHEEQPYSDERTDDAPEGEVASEPADEFDFGLL